MNTREFSVPLSVTVEHKEYNAFVDVRWVIDQEVVEVAAKLGWIKPTLLLGVSQVINYFQGENSSLGYDLENTVLYRIPLERQHAHIPLVSKDGNVFFARVVWVDKHNNDYSPMKAGFVRLDRSLIPVGEVSGVSYGVNYSQPVLSQVISTTLPVFCPITQADRYDAAIRDIVLPRTRLELWQKRFTSLAATFADKVLELPMYAAACVVVAILVLADIYCFFANLWRDLPFNAASVKELSQARRTEIARIKTQRRIAKAMNRRPWSWPSPVQRLIDWIWQPVSIN